MSLQILRGQLLAFTQYCQVLPAFGNANTKPIPEPLQAHNRRMAMLVTQPGRPCIVALTTKLCQFLCCSRP